MPSMRAQHHCYHTTNRDRRDQNRTAWHPIRGVHRALLLLLLVAWIPEIECY